MYSFCILGITVVYLSILLPLREADGCVERVRTARCAPDLATALNSKQGRRQ